MVVYTASLLTQEIISQKMTRVCAHGIHGSEPVPHYLKEAGLIGQDLKTCVSGVATS